MSEVRAFRSAASSKIDGADNVRVASWRDVSLDSATRENESRRYLSAVSITQHRNRKRERKRVRDTLDVSLGTGWFHGAIDQSSRARGSIDRRYHARDVCIYKTQPRIFKSPVPYKAFTARICLFEHRAIIAIPSRSYYAETRAFSIARGSRYRRARCVIRCWMYHALIQCEETCIHISLPYREI